MMRGTESQGRIEGWANCFNRAGKHHYIKFPSLKPLFYNHLCAVHVHLSNLTELLSAEMGTDVVGVNLKWELVTHWHRRTMLNDVQRDAPARPDSGSDTQWSPSHHLLSLCCM